MKDSQDGNSIDDVEDDVSEMDDFKIDDIDSLQDACIDNELLQNQFLNQESKEENFKKQFLIKYARTYGYMIVNKEDLFAKKLKYLKLQ